MMDDETSGTRSAELKYEVKDFSTKSTADDITARFDADVERFSNLETGQSATIDAPLSMQLITEAAVRLTPKIERVLDIGCGAGNNTLKLRQVYGKVSREDELLHAAAIEDFGSWDTALEYSGVRARDVARSRDLGAERTEQQLRHLCTTGYDLGAKVNRSRNRTLYDAALRYHGSWRTALTAAGINLSNVSRRRPKHLDRETMILWLQDRHAEGQNLSWTEVCLENRDHALAIRRVFASWRKALVAAGVADLG